MAQDADELRAQIDAQRSEITGTVEQIENRIRPGRIMARRRDRIRRTMIDWKDSVFGNDEPDYPHMGWYPAAQNPYASGALDRRDDRDDDTGLMARASGTVSSVSDAPDMVRRQTRGNPIAAGLIAAGAGWLIGGVLPRSERERSMARRIEPALSDAADVVKHEGQELAGELREPVREATDEVKHTGEAAIADLRDEAKDAAGSVRESASGRSGGSPVR
jgi:hypothetical protein